MNLEAQTISRAKRAHRDYQKSRRLKKKLDAVKGWYKLMETHLDEWQRAAFKEAIRK